MNSLLCARGKVVVAAMAATVLLIDTAAALDGTWLPSLTSGSWGSSSSWTDGVIPGDGGTAVFNGSSVKKDINISNSSTVTLSRVYINTNGVENHFHVTGGAIKLVAPAYIQTDHRDFYLEASSPLLSDEDVTFTGFGRFFLTDSQDALNGRVIISNGWFITMSDRAIGPAPASLRKDAIILDNGILCNYNAILDLSPNRGITLTSRGGYLSAGFPNGGFRANSPITGTGSLGLDYQFSTIYLCNPSNDYTGDTLIGSKSASADVQHAKVCLGANDVIPDGEGKGDLSFGSFPGREDLKAILDLCGKTDTVNRVIGTVAGDITSSVAGQGLLRVGALGGNSQYDGTLEGGATIVQVGGGSFTFTQNATLSGGAISVDAGTVDIQTAKSHAANKIILNGGALNIGVPSLGSTLVLSQDAAINISNTVSSFSLGHIITNAPATLTVNGYSGVVGIGSSEPDNPAIYDTPISAPGGFCFTNYVWLLGSLPAGISISRGATISPYGDRLLGDAAFSLTDYNVRLAEGCTLGDGSMAVNPDRILTLDTLRYTDGAFNTSSTNVFTFTNAIALQGGSLLFRGNGTNIYSGTISGTGVITNDTLGVTRLQGSSAATDITFIITNGTLSVEKADALANMTVKVMNGMTTCLALDPPEDATLSVSSVSLPIGGWITVPNASRTVTLNPLENCYCSIGGKGTLVLGGDTSNTGARLAPRTGTLVLKKSGTAYAAEQLFQIDLDATVKLDGESTNQINNSVYFNSGTLDLNGHSEGITSLTNSSSEATIVNNGSAPATLTVGEHDADGTFTGTFTDGTGTLGIRKVGTGTLALSGTGLAYSGATTVDAGTLAVNGTLSVRARFLRLQPTATRPNGDYAYTGYQLDEFRLLLNGKVVVNPSETTATCPHDPLNYNERAAKLVDGMLYSKWYKNDNSFHDPATIDYGSVMEFDSYQWATAGDAPGRDPIAWTLEKGVLENGVTNWTVISVVTNFSPTTARNTWQAAVPISAEYILERAAPLAENSPVTVASGATLVLNRISQSLTALSGNGTLSLSNSVITLPDPTSFQGTINGKGTIVLTSGTGVTPAFRVMSPGIIVRNDSNVASVYSFTNTTPQVVAFDLRDGKSAFSLEQAGSGTTYLLNTNSAYTGATSIRAGSAIAAGAYISYVKFAPTKLRGGNIDYQFSEFELVRNGSKVAWPSGTTASAVGGVFGGNGGEGPDKAIDGSVYTKLYSSNGLFPLIIHSPSPLVFDSYRWYTANDTPTRSPVSWTVSISSDGQEWTVVDTRLDQDVTNGFNTLVGTYSVSTFAAPGGLKVDAFSDVSATTVSAPGTLGVLNGAETVGSLSGNGSVSLTEGSLNINAFENAAFTGGITGSGVLTVSGVATQKLSGAIAYSGDLIVSSGTLDLTGATLTGVTNIILRGGTLIGTATVAGDLTVTYESGVYGASLNVTGALSLSGTLSCAVPAADAYPLHLTCFTVGSASDATRAAFLASRPVTAVPGGVTAKGRINGNAFLWSVSKNGFVIMLK